MKSEVTMELDQLLQLCLKHDRKAQKKLFDMLGPKMKVVCKRYLFEPSQADEVLNQGFLKVFTKLSSYKGDGSFEGWVRRIMVRESLNKNRSKNLTYQIDEHAENQFLNSTAEVDQSNNVAHIMRVIDALPDGYKTIFNLIEIEGYTHEEVAKQLKISTGTSRSQLSRAKQLLRTKLRNIDGL